MKFKIFTPFDRASLAETWQIVDFLYDHLDEYGDAREDIHKALQYALKKRPSMGGFILAGYEEEEIVGAVVINKTGMEGYIPENILVYIAVHGDHRGEGVGSRLMDKAIDLAEGDIALHVEPDNPALYLYEKLGFENKYLEMRLSKEDNASPPARKSADQKTARVEN
jgi:ribosomal-protein-alanine N-acetyltransferase